MSTASTILQIVRQGDFSHMNFFNMSCGGTDLCGSSNHLLIGLIHHLYYQTIFLKRRKKYLCECNTQMTCCTIQLLLKLQSPEAYYCMGLSFYQQVSKTQTTPPPPPSICPLKSYLRLNAIGSKSFSTPTSQKKWKL